MKIIKLDVIFETVGRTRTDKMVIVAAKFEDVKKVIDYLKTTEHFTADDFLDAYAQFNYLALRAQRKNKPSTIFEHHAIDVFEKFERDQFEQAKIKAGIITAFDFQIHALILIKEEFKKF